MILARAVGSVSTAFFVFMLRPPPTSTLFPYTTLFRSAPGRSDHNPPGSCPASSISSPQCKNELAGQRSEEHTSELQSRENLVCRLLHEKKKVPRHGIASCARKRAPWQASCARGSPRGW